MRRKDKTGEEDKQDTSGQPVVANEILTSQQAAELLRVHPRTLYNLIKGNQIPYVRIGGEYRFSRARLEELLRAPPERVLSSKRRTRKGQG